MTGKLSQLPQMLIDELSSAEGLQEVRWFSAFSAAHRQLPLKGIGASVDIARVTMEQGRYSGLNTEGKEVFACPVSAELEVNLICSPKEDAVCLREAFGAICDRLMLCTGELGTVQVSCEGIGYDSDVMGLRLKAMVKLSPLAVHLEQTAVFESLRLIQK